MAVSKQKKIGEILKVYFQHSGVIIEPTREFDSAKFWVFLFKFPLLFVSRKNP